MDDYDIGKIFMEIEIELINSMKRNLKGHQEWEKDEGFDWDQWQAKKIRELLKYKNQNLSIMNGYNMKLSQGLKADLLRQYLEGGTKVDKEIEEAFKYGLMKKETPGDDFFQGNNRKLDALIKSVNKDMDNAKHAALRMMDDEYRKVIFRAESYLATGSTNLDKAIDIANRDFLARGINCITYSNGNKVNIASYARMAVRTANKRVYLMGEGERRKEWGESLVLISQYMGCSDLCLPWQGRVYIDDVYSGGKIEDGPYPLLSQAIEAGLFHPSCRHTSSTFFEGISTVPEPLRDDENGEMYQHLQRDAEIQRNIQKYKRLSTGSLDASNQSKYKDKMNQWEKKLRQHRSSKNMVYNSKGKVKQSKSNPSKVNQKSQPANSALRTQISTGTNIQDKMINKLKDIFDKWNKKDIKSLAKDIVDEAGLSIPIYRRKINERGYCSIATSGNRIKIQDYVLQSNDPRSQKYQVKTMFHELFHAKSNGLTHNINGRNGFKNWAYMDDIFAECNAHYMMKRIGIKDTLTPSYPEYLVDALPRLKKLPEFAHCKSISDFGEVAIKFRYGSNPTADWNSLQSLMQSQKHDIINYSKQYIPYINNHADDLIDKLLDNMPLYRPYKSSMMNDLDIIKEKVKFGGTMSSNEKMVFSNVLILAMNEEGVR